VLAFSFGLLQSEQGPKRWSEGAKICKRPFSTFSGDKALKSHKTAKEKLGKTWRKAWKNLARGLQNKRIPWKDLAGSPPV
jgi:hypothetical protein